MENCNIYTWSTSGHPNLRSLSMAHNNLDHNPNFCSKDGVHLYLRLQTLGLAFNHLKTLNMRELGCLSNVQKLDLTDNALTSLVDNTFSLMPRINTLTLDKSTKLTSYQRFAFNSSTLKILNIRKSPPWDQSKTPQDLFRYCPKLEKLDFTSTKLKVAEGFLRQLLIPLKQLTDLNLASSNTYIIPRDTLGHLPRLQVLDMAGNGISTWDPSAFVGVGKLSRLILSENNIQTVTEGSFPLEIWRSLKSLNLARNQYNCVCELRWFAEWLQAVYSNKSVKVDNYPQDYKCRSPMSLHDKLLQSYRPSWFDCLGPNIILAFVLPPTFIVLVVALAVLYRYRINVRLWVYLLCRKRKGYELIPAGDSFLFEAFISYSKDDSSWVVAEVLPLEKELGLKICIHQRDFKVGWLIVDNIMGNMEASRKIILVLSNSFARSEWCQFELQEALEYFLRRRKDVVLVLLEPIATRNLTRPLRLLLEKTTYLEWKDCQSARRMLRERLLEPFQPQAEEP